MILTYFLFISIICPGKKNDLKLPKAINSYSIPQQIIYKKAQNTATCKIRKKREKTENKSSSSQLIFIIFDNLNLNV